MTTQSIYAAIVIVLLCPRASAQWIQTNVRAFRRAVLVTVLAISSIAHVYAQSGKGAFEGGIETGPFLLMATGGRETIGVLGLFAEPRVGYFLTDDLDVGATGFFYHSIDSDPSLPSISFGGASGHANYHFSSGSRMSPYIGARIGVLKSNAEALFGFGAQLGLKYFVARQFSINGQLAVSVYPGSAGVAFLACLGLGLSYHTE